MNAKLAIAAVLVFVALYRVPATPAPEPTPTTRLNLKGMFVGETAAEDAATLAGMCSEIADEIEWDGQQTEPLLKTGVAMDTLRTRARVARMKGVSIGDRQPRVRDEIGSHLRREVGENGGLLEPEDRARWVSAYRDIAEACRHAIGR